MIPLPAPKHASPYNKGFDDGMEVGKKIADERYFWMGIGAGFMVLLCVFLALYLFGAFPL